MIDLPLPPQDEFDSEGRHVHPYVRNPELDPSAGSYVTNDGEEITQEWRSRESRLTFHAAENLIGHLTPDGLAHIIQSCVHRLYWPALAADFEAQGITREQLDVRGELIPFEDLHRPRLAQIHEAIEVICATCSNCGRVHLPGEGHGLQPGAYVRSDTGASVRVLRVEAEQVHVRIEHEGGSVDHVWVREWFEKHYVRAEDVEILPVEPEQP